MDEADEEDGEPPNEDDADDDDDDAEVDDDVDEDDQRNGSAASGSSRRSGKRNSSAGSNRSATTPAFLPTSRTRSSDGNGVRVYDHDLVRTDAKMQTLDKVWSGVEGRKLKRVKRTILSTTAIYFATCSLCSKSAETRQRQSL